MEKKVVKILFVLVFLLEGAVVMQAQNQVILNFTGKNQNNDFVKMDSVFVENTTQRWQEVLYYPDTTLFIGTTGIHDPSSEEINLHLCQNVPNPFDGVTEFSLQLPEKSDLTLEIYDLSGKLTATYKGTLEQGNHLFKAWVTVPQTYLLSAKSQNGVARIKMVNVGNAGQNSIEYLGMGSTISIGNHNDDSKGGTLLPFTPGDWMKYRGYARIADSYFESQQIVQKQYVSQDIELKFDIPLPAVTTLSATDVLSTLATLHGNVTNQTNYSVTNVGFYVADNFQMNNASRYDLGPGNGNFQFTVSGLELYTQHYFLAFATTALGTEYGNISSFITLAEPPAVTTGDVTDITATSASCSGQVTFGGGASVTARGVCWSTSPNPTLANDFTTDGTGLGGFTSTMSGLTPGTTYYVRAYATNIAGTTYGEQTTFTTLAVLPIVTTNSVSNITPNTATCGGDVTYDGGANVTARGICWSTSQNPTVNNSYTTNGNGIGSFTSSMTELSPGTTYYVRAYATNSVGTAYGEQRSFTTLTTPPSVTTNTISNIMATSATCGGDVSATGGATVTARGVCWSTSQNPTVSNSHTTNGSGMGSFTSNLTGLNPGTTYFVRAYATNSAGTAYGEQRSFTTTDTIPTVTTNTVSNITATSATCGGNVTATGGATVTARGVCWSTSQNPTVNDSHTTDGSGTGSFTSSITGLEAGTTYYVRAYATNSEGTAYGVQRSFTTLATPPTLTTDSIRDITATTANCGGNVTANGGATVTARGVCWSTSQNPTVSNSHTTNGSGTGNFTSNITGLNPGTTYYVRAYASNSAGTGYGEQRSFTTSDSTPTVTTNAVSNITATSATCGGNVTATGGATVTARGVCWSTSQNPTVNDSHTTDGSGTGSFTSSITGLEAGTTYYVRAYATNSEGTAYGVQRSFTTLATPPTLTTDSIRDITATTANCGGNVTANGGATVTARGVCWSTSQNPTVSNSHTTNGSGTGNFTSNITGLNPGTTYYVRAYASNSAGTGYGEQRSFTTSDTTPTVTTNAVSNITGSTATCGGNVTSDGGATVTARGVCWSTSQNPTMSNSHTTDGSGTGSFTSSITGLTAGTTYYVRAYATNSAGTAYGEQQSFTASANPPTVTTNTVSNIEATSATCGGNVTSDGGAAVTARGVCWSTSQNPTVSNSYTTDGSGTGSFTSSISGLTAGITYYVRAYATNSAGTAYGEQRSFTTTASSSPCDESEQCTFTFNLTDSFGDGWNGGSLSVQQNGVSVATITLSSGYTGTETVNLCNNVSTSLVWTPGYFVNEVGFSIVDPDGNQVYSVSGMSNYTTYTFTPSCAEIIVPASGSSTITSCDAWIYDNGGSTGNYQNSSNGYLVVTPATTGQGILLEGTYNIENGYDNIYVYAGAGTSGTQLGSYSGSGSISLTHSGTVTIRFTSDVSVVYSGFAIHATCVSATLPTVTTNTVSNITATSASCGGNVASDGGATVTARGVCWSTSQNPTVSNSHTTDGSGIGSFTSSITGLTAGTTYYVRAYATNSAGTAYGEQRSFTALATIPTVTTNTVSNIEATSATTGGNVTSDGGAAVTARGVCWSTSQNPTVSNSHTIDGSGTGSFTSSITGLMAGTTYYVRAYATNSAGTAYGEQRSFTTSASSPCDVSDQCTYTFNLTDSYGDGWNGGSLSVQQNGFSMATITLSSGSVGTEMVNLCNNIPASLVWTAGSYVGEVGFSIVDPDGNQLYSVSGMSNYTTYTFTPNCNSSSFTCGTSTVSDYDGNTYNTVQIGTQCWMKENLKTTHLNNGTSIPLVQDTTAWQQYSTPAYCYYNKTTYGCLYNFYAVQSGNLCPTGWHVPSYSEVHSTLYNALEGTSVGGKMKTTGTTYWASPNTGATNSSGFSARAGGYRPSGYATREITLHGVFWTSTTYDNSDYELAYNYMLSYEYADMFRYGIANYDYSMLMSNGLSVRCLRDDSGGGTASLPTVSTNMVSNIMATSATSGGNVTSDGGSTVTARGVCWSTSQNPTVNNSHTIDGNGTGSFTSSITGLTAGITYYVRAYATNSAGTAYGEQRSFVTNTNTNTGGQGWFNLIDAAYSYYGVDLNGFAPPIQCDTLGLYPFSSGNSPVQFCSVGQVFNWDHSSWNDLYDYIGAPQNLPNMPSATSYSVDSIQMIYSYRRGTNVSANVVDTIAFSYIIGFDPEEDVRLLSNSDGPVFVMPALPFNNTTFLASTTSMTTSGFTNTLDQSTIIYDKIPLTVDDETIDPYTGENVFYYLTLPTPEGLSNLSQKQMAVIVTFIPGCARTPNSIIGVDLNEFRTALYDDPREGYSGTWGTPEVLEDYQLGLFHDANNFNPSKYFYNMYQPNIFWSGNPKPWISLLVTCPVAPMSPTMRETSVLLCRSAGIAGSRRICGQRLLRTEGNASSQLPVSTTRTWTNGSAGASTMMPTMHR